MREREIQHIFFDVGDTLRITNNFPEHRLNAKRRAAQLLETDQDPEAFAAVIEERYEEYRRWATTTWIELPEEELWTRFLAPEFPPERVKPLAVELTFLLRQFKGLRLTADHALDVVQELTRRGYKLGIISNVITSRELPDWIEEEGFAPYFNPVVLSSLTGYRKPHQEIFNIALRESGTDAQHCCYIGDNVERDMGGANSVGFGMKILIDHKGVIPREFTEETKPDAIISGCMDLLELFPAYPKVNDGAPQIWTESGCRA